MVSLEKESIKLLKTLVTMAKSKLAGNSIYYTIIGLFPQMVGFITLPILSNTNYLSEEEYGTYALINTFTTFISIFLSLEIESGVSRLYFDYDDNGRKKYLSTLYYTTIFIGLLSLLIFMLSGQWMIDTMFKSPMDFSPYFLIACVSIGFNLSSNITTAFFKVQEKARDLAVFSFIAAFLRASLVVYFVIYLRMGLLGPVLAILISSVLILVMQTFYYRKYFVASFDLRMLKENLKFSIPVIPHALGGYLFMYSDKVVLDHLLKVENVLWLIGVYNIADIFSMVLKIFVNAFSKAFMPVFIKRAKESVVESIALVNRISAVWFIALGFAYYVLINIGDSL